MINSVLDNGDWAQALEAGVPLLLETHSDIWAYIEDYWGKYETLPTKKIIKDHFSDFDMINTRESPFQYYVDEAKKIVLSRNVRKNLNEAIEILKRSGPNVAMNFMASTTFSLMRESGGLKDTNLSEDYMDRVKEYTDRYHSDSHVMGIPSDIGPIDEIFGGFQKGDLVCVMGWTGSKKSWLALLFAINAWKHGCRPLVISLEMNKYQTGFRFDTILNGGESFTNDQLTHARQLDPQSYEHWARRTFDGMPPFYLVTSDSMDGTTQASIEAKVEYYKPDLVVVDYHQLVDDARRGGTEAEKNKNISKDFKRMALKYEIPFIDICSVTVKAGDVLDKPPSLDQIAWSRQMAFDADLVLSIFSEKHSNTLQVVSEKVRRCEDFAFNLDWDVNRGVWRDVYGERNEVGF